MPAIQLALAALSNAHYHQVVLETVIRDPALFEVGASASEDDHARANIRFQAHLRGFFWELTSTLEMLLQHVNDTFRLEVDLVRSRTVKESLKALRRAASTHARAVSAAALLSEAFKAAWCHEVFRYRNSAHLTFLMVEGLYSAAGESPPLMALQPAGRGQEQRFLPQALEHYRTKMLALANEFAQHGLASRDPNPSA